MSAALAQAPPAPDETAGDALLASAQQAISEKQYPVAAERFHEYLKTHGGGRHANAARYGLGLCFLNGPQRDLQQALEQLAGPARDAAFADRPSALYYLAFAYRAEGFQALAESLAKPQEATRFQDLAREQFRQAQTQFGAAAEAFLAQAGSVSSVDEKRATSVEWALRCRGEQAEMLLRLSQPQAARDLLEPLLEKTARTPSRCRGQLLYDHGQACYALKDYAAAGRSLSELAPFTDPVSGVHAQYLLARTLHLLGERAAAQALYAAVPTSYEKQRAAAQLALQNAALAQQPEEKLRLEQLVNAPPEFVGRARFENGVLLYELEKFSEAEASFAAFLKAHPQSPLAAEAQLRQGLCDVALRQFPQALNTLNPLLDHPLWSDRALLYSARATMGQADPKQPQPFAQTMTQVADRLRLAAERAQQRIPQDAAARARCAECRLEQGHALLQAKDFAAAVAVYTQALAENNAAPRAEEFLERLATAQGLAGRYDAADEVCAQYLAQFPRGDFVGAIRFRQAENAFGRAAAAEPARPLAPESPAGKLSAEAIARARLVTEKFPELPQMPLVRYHLGSAYYRLGDDAHALAEFKAIESADRQGELAPTAYYQADILLRTMSPDASDALAAGRQVQTLTEAAKLLESFAAGDANEPLMPSALLKLGVCYTQLATLTADANERRATFENAGKQFTAVATRYGGHPLVARAVFEQANLRLAMNDVNGAISDLNRFRSDPYRNAEVAPLALARLGGLLCGQNKADEAVPLLEQARQQYEAGLLGDPARQAWALVLLHEQGLAVKQQGRLADARALFETAVQKFAALPDVYASAWRAGQCRREAALAQAEAPQQVLARAKATAEERTAAQAQLAELGRELAASGQTLRDAAAQMTAKKIRQPEMYQQLLYEAAWCYRTAGELELAWARRNLADAAAQQQQSELARRFPPPAKAPPARAVEIPLAAIPLPPSEQTARKVFQEAILVQAESPLAQLARVELSELLTRRGELAPAIALLQEALNAEPPPEIEERVRVCLGVALLAQGDAPRALNQFAPVAANEKSPLMPAARYRQGECYLAQKDWGKAIERLQAFRDYGPLQNLAGVSDRALLRLGDAAAQAGQWDQSRTAYEQVLNRFGNNSPWRFAARYSQGWALAQMQQYDAAVDAYQQVVNESAGEFAAKAQFQIAVCRAQQKRPEAAAAFLAVADAYDYPEYGAPALLEAARLLAESAQPEAAAGAAKLWERVLRDYPATDWAQAAAAELAKPPKPAAP